MLLELRIQNLAVIEQLSIHLESGLNALTGETGAGKSIVVGALSLLLGERASADVIRTGAPKAIVEGVFDVAQRKEVLAALAEQGIEAHDGLLILRREVAVEGRSRAWVNGAAGTAAQLAELGRMLVDLHGQHEHQTLLKRVDQRAILDEYAGATDLAEEVAAAHAMLRSAEAKLADLERRRREATKRADYLRYQVSEIESARLRVDEEDEIAGEALRLEHAEELSNVSRHLHDAVYASEESLTSKLGDLRRTLDHLIRVDESQTELRELFESAYYALEELGRRAGEYSASIEHDPERLHQIRARQDLLYRLKGKYGPTIEEVIVTGERAREELGLVDDADVARHDLEKELGVVREELERAANALTKQRKKAATRLQKEVAELLPDLGMTTSNFEVALEPQTPVAPSGAEAVEFRIALNPGLEPRGLARIASGGELSRVMLALKTILARVDRVPTLVFDEIDAGIGGRVAVQVGAKLRDVASHHQVFVITHLPQIASRANHHLLVEKSEQEGTTLTRVTELDGEERVRELARMLGGDPESDASLQHARELLG